MCDSSVSPYISLSPYLLPVSPYISLGGGRAWGGALFIPISPYISPHLPTSPYIS